MKNYFDSNITELLKIFTRDEIKMLLNLETAFYKRNDLLKLEAEIFKIFKNIKTVELIVANINKIRNLKEDEFLNAEIKKVLQIKEIGCSGCINLDCFYCKKYTQEQPIKYNYGCVRILKKNSKVVYLPEIKESVLLSHIEHKLKSINISTSKIIVYPIGFDIKYAAMLLISKDIDNFTVICDDELLFNFFEKHGIQIYKSIRARKKEFKKNVLLINIKDEYIFILCKTRTVFLFYEQFANLFTFSKYFNVQPTDIYLFKNAFYDIEFVTSSDGDVFLEDGSTNLGYSYKRGNSELLDKKLIKIINEISEKLVVYSFSKSIISLIYKELLKNEEINTDEINLSKEYSNYYKFGLGVYNKNMPGKDLILEMFNQGKIRILVSDSQIITEANVLIFYDFECKDSLFKRRNKNQKVIFLCDEILQVNKLEFKSSLLNLINGYIQKDPCKLTDIYNFFKDSFSNYSRNEINFYLKRLIRLDLVKYGNQTFIGTNKGRLAESFSIKESNFEVLFDKKFYSQNDIFEVLNQTEEIKNLGLKPIKQTLNLSNPQNNRIINELEKDFFLDLPIPTHKHTLIYEFYQLTQNKKSKLPLLIISLLKTIFYILIEEKNTIAIEVARLINLVDRKSVKLKIHNETLSVSGKGEVDLFLVNYNNDILMEYKKAVLSEKELVAFKRDGICVVVYGNNCDMFECFSD